MAMSGYALNDHTPDGVMQEIKNTMLFLEHRPDLVYDWLESKGHSWRIYSSGMPFFLQVASMFARYESGNGQFREIEKLGEDALNDDLPDVAFVEPFYWCDPRKEGTAASDDHAPASLAGGQRFLNIVRDAIVGPETIARNKDLWDRLLMIVTYDEHGSFFDHVPPPKVPTKPEPPASYPQFDTLGLRVPAIVISPFVKSGYVHKGVLDHTSILKFLGEKFGDGHYSDLVDNRGVGSLSDVLDSDLLASSADIPDPPQP